MDNKNDAMEFELEDILSEFHDLAEEDSLPAEEAGDVSLSQLIPEMELDPGAEEALLADVPAAEITLPAVEEPDLSAGTIRFEPQEAPEADAQVPEEAVTDEPTFQLPVLTDPEDTAEADAAPQQPAAQPVAEEDFPYGQQKRRHGI